jgi:ADP-ribose pyrophosphatase YjhB (NUDIX family)
LLGGAANVGESYEAAAARELAEETGVHAPVRFRVTYLCHGAISPYWLAVHEAVITADIHPDPAEIAWHRWMTETEVRNAVQHWPFVPDGLVAYACYLAAPC